MSCETTASHAAGLSHNKHCTQGSRGKAVRPMHVGNEEDLAMTEDPKSRYLIFFNRVDAHGWDYEREVDRWGRISEVEFGDIDHYISFIAKILDLKCKYETSKASVLY